VLDAGRFLPTTGPPTCQAVAIEAPVMRQALVEALTALPSLAPAGEAVRQAPVLVALCDSGDGAGAPAAWMAAAQMALAAEEEGLASLVLPTVSGMTAPRALHLPPGWRLEAVLALGLPARRTDRPEASVEPQQVPGYLAAAPPPEASGTPGDDRQVLLSFMEIAAATAAAEDMDGVLETIARALGRLFPVDGAALGLLEEDGVVAREILRRGGAVRRDPQRLAADRSHLLGWVIDRERPLWRNDVAAEMRFAESLPAAGMRSDMTIPLRARGRVIGAFRVACRRRHAFDPEDFDLLQRCADVTAVAVETQRLLLATRRLSEVDGLTGIFNHRHFLGLLDLEVERARRADHPVSLLMIDIDDFKSVNDTCGHQAGDEVLRHVAQLSARLLRRSDVVARYGGEELAAILPEAGLDAAAPIAETIRAGVEKSPLIRPSPGRPIQVRVSVGVACFPSDALNTGDLVAAADRGLYQAKRAGKNRVCHWSPGGLSEQG
jgi:diguanylate cyclase (GGDEF)-like protein